MTALLRILLVEDEPVDVMTARRAIARRALPVELSVVESAEEGIEVLRNGCDPAPSEAGLPDLVIADLRLPQLSGIDLLERCKADPDLRGIPFVLVSTSCQEAEVEAAYQHGAVGYFVKPLAFEAYADLLDRIVAFYLAVERPSSPSSSGGVVAAAEVTDHYLERELRALLQDDSLVFDFIQDGATDGIWYWDLESPEHEWMSSGFWQTLGYDPSSKPHLSSAWQDLVDPEDLQKALANFEKHCLDETYDYDQIVRYRHREGSTVWIRCCGYAIRDRGGRPVRMLGFHRDVTARMDVEERCAAAEARLRSIAAILSGEGATKAVEAGGDTSVVARIRSVLAERDSAGG